MTPTTIAQLAGMRAGTILEGIRGTLTKVYSDRKDGETEHGPWSFQNALFEDEKGGKCRLKFKNRDLIPGSWEGREIEIVSPDDKKAKGVEVTEYNGKKELTIHKSAEVNFLDGRRERRDDTRRDNRDNYEETRRVSREDTRRDNHEETRQARREEPPARRETQDREPAPRTRTEAPRETADPVHALRTDLGKLMHLHAHCYDAAAAEAWNIFHRHKQIMPGAAVGALATSFFIEMCRRGHALSLPVVDVTKLPLKGRPVAELCEMLQERGVELHRQKAAAAAATSAPAAKPEEDPADRWERMGSEQTW